MVTVSPRGRNLPCPTCPICLESDASPVPGPPDPWRYYRCHRCGHWWLHPPPTEGRLSEFYNRDYTVPAAEYFTHIRQEGPPMVRLLQSLRPSLGRVLEIGCSYGGMLAALRDAGWDAHGIELDARAADYARRTYGLPVTSTRIETAAAELTPPYDAITSYHVIEHVVELPPFVIRLRSLCRDGALLVLTTPNNRSIVARAGAAWWQWAIGPEHVHLFSPKSLRIVLEKHGFAVRFVTSRRGHAEPTPFELLRALALRTIVPHRGVHEPGDPYAVRREPLPTRPWLKRSERLARLTTVPLDVLWGLATRTGTLIEPEMLMVATARD